MTLFAGIGNLFSAGASEEFARQNSYLAATIDLPVKRFLQERSFLVFEFSKPGSGGDREFCILPFFENISIVEDQKANFAVYDLIGRAGNLYGYMGAKSRSFKLNFRMNVKHIQYIFHREGVTIQDFSFKTVNSDNKEELRKLFINPPALLGQVSKELQNTLSEKAAFDYMSLLLKDPDYSKNIKNKNQESKDKYFKDVSESSLYKDGYKDAVRAGRERSKFLNNVAKTNPFGYTINFVIWWVNLIRTSTINNSQNSVYGPPIIRINHGLLYNNVPCICTNYSFREAINTTYDVPNLFPDIIEVSMSLEEIRNSGEPYEKGKENGDSVAGWNDFLRNKTMDPYNGIWGER